jgi:hypothetical protein
VISPVWVVSVLEVGPGERVVVDEAEVLEPGAVEAVLRLDAVHAPVHRHLGAAGHQPVPAEIKLVTSYEYIKLLKCLNISANIQ